MRRGQLIKLCGMFEDQRGVVEVGKTTGYNGEGTPFREYRWVKNNNKKLIGKKFEAADDQIRHARSRCGRE